MRTLQKRMLEKVQKDLEDYSTQNIYRVVKEALEKITDEQDDKMMVLNALASEQSECHKTITACAEEIEAVLIDVEEM